MNKSTIIFILSLVAVANASSVQMYSKIDAHPFGASLMNLVQINMQSSDQSKDVQLDQINQVLLDIKNEMVQAKQTADGNHQQYQAKCDTDIAKQTKDLNNSKNSLQTTQDQLKTDRASNQKAQDDLKTQQDHLVDVKNQIKVADENNDKAWLAYNSKVKDLNSAIDACKEATLELAKLNSGSFIQGRSISLIQIQGGMKQIEKTLQTHLPQRLIMYRPILSALSQLGTDADPAAVKAIQDLINQLKGQLETELSVTKANELQRTLDYTKTRATLVSDQNKTETQIINLQSLIEQLTKSIQTNQDIEQALLKLIPDQEKVLKERQEQCQKENSDYQIDDKSRVDELAIIDELISFFQQKFKDGFTDYLKSRVQF